MVTLTTKYKVIYSLSLLLFSIHMLFVTILKTDEWDVIHCLLRGKADI